MHTALTGKERKFTEIYRKKMKRIFPGITKMQASSIKRINIERESIAGSEGHKSKALCYSV